MGIWVKRLGKEGAGKAVKEARIQYATEGEMSAGEEPIEGGGEGQGDGDLFISLPNIPSTLPHPHHPTPLS